MVTHRVVLWRDDERAAVGKVRDVSDGERRGLFVSNFARFSRRRAGVRKRERGARAVVGFRFRRDLEKWNRVGEE